MYLDVVVPKQFNWWAALAMLLNPRYDEFSRLRFRDSIPIDAPDNLAVSSHLLRYPLSRIALRQANHAEVLLWDGLRDFGESAHEIATLRQARGQLQVSAVGRNRHLDAAIAYDLLYAQDLDRYRNFDASYSFYLSRAEVVEGVAERWRLRHRRSLITVKHAFQRPADVGSRRRELVFAGQSGRLTLGAAAALTTPLMQRFVTALREFEVSRRSLDVPLEAVVHHLLVEQSLRGYGWFLAAKSVTRAYLLEALHRAGLPCNFTFYPAANVNVYQSRLLRKGLYLDFGSANGEEEVYPRSADLLIADKEVLRLVAPPTILYADSLASRDTAKDIEGLVARAVDRAADSL